MFVEVAAKGSVAPFSGHGVYAVVCDNGRVKLHCDSKKRNSRISTCE